MELERFARILDQDFVHAIKSRCRLQDKIDGKRGYPHNALEALTRPWRAPCGPYKALEGTLGAL